MEENHVSLQNLELEKQHPNVSGLNLVNETEPPPPSPFPSLEEVEETIGYSFRDKELLESALTHGSDKSNDSYEVLEYYGDAFLNYLIAKQHFSLYRNGKPGELTRLRSANVDNEVLARAALKYKLHKSIRHKIPHLDEKIEKFIEATEEYPLHSFGMIDPPKILADVFESLIAAVHVDTGESVEATSAVVMRWLQPLITPDNLGLNPVTKFNEACQKMKLKPHSKDMWKETGEIEFYINNELIGRGKCKSKRKMAMNKAADDAYKNLFEKLRNNDDGIGSS